ncbi:hypothetical protein PENTCL1PPCAC_15823 [Pristionchus entomophagus]|uniref:G protein-coupled receptor n=1 Tax=Pristionchus entomophagus TaxID=358040 RepID=A0AAV5THD2_9BILA|nr:hypothetical protein PENTCL1PPCAC_15823 [Pristionchus entomophagus]
MGDDSIEFGTVALTYGSTVISLLSLPITIDILFVLSHASSPAVFQNAFFTFCKFGLVTGILVILVMKLLVTVPALGWFIELYTTGDVVKRSFYFLNWSLRTMQGFTNTFICVNRATAVLLPFLHLKKTLDSMPCGSFSRRAEPSLWLAVIDLFF